MSARNGNIWGDSRRAVSAPLSVLVSASRELDSGEAEFNKNVSKLVLVDLEVPLLRYGDIDCRPEPKPHLAPIAFADHVIEERERYLAIRDQLIS